jgi:hypothetical protein
LAGALLDRLRVPTAVRTRVVHLVRHHMFRYEPSWGDPAVRRFLAKVGPAAIDQLFALREADNVGSGVARDADHLEALRSRIAAELASGAILDRSALAIDGEDLMTEMGIAQGPDLGRILGILFERVVENPGLNERGQLLAAARELAGSAARPGHASAEAPAAVEGPASALSIQLYTVRAALADDAGATLARLAEIGFRQVEPFDLLTYFDQLRDGLSRHGLAAPTAHIGLIGDAPLDEILDAAVELGIGTLIQPWTEPKRWRSEPGVREIAAALSAVAVRAAGRGIRVG